MTRCNDVVAAGAYGTGMIHLGDGAGGFDGGQDLPQIGYQNPATATRVTMAVGDLTGDGHPEIVIADRPARAGDGLPQHLLGVRRRVLAPPPPPPPSAATASAAASAASAAAAVPRTCDNPGTTPFTVGTPGDDVLVGTHRPRRAQRARRGRLPVRALRRRPPDRRHRERRAQRRRRRRSDERRRRRRQAQRRQRQRHITPGAGKDKVAANGGNDTISARDGTRDTIDCGGGHDKVTADRTDTVKHCEFVKRKGARRAHHH